MKILLYGFVLFMSLSLKIYAFTPSFELVWENVLQNHVQELNTDGLFSKGIDYEKMSDSQTFFSLIRLIESTNPSDLKTIHAKKAFWINVYNIACIKLMIENKFENAEQCFHKGRFDQIPAITVDQVPYSLKEIREDILPEYQDPRVYFAIDTCFVSGPNLNTKAYTQENVEALLTEQVKAVMSDKRKGVFINRNTKIIYVSLIFKDISQYLPKKFSIKDFLETYFSESFFQYEIEFLDFSTEFNHI